MSQSKKFTTNPNIERNDLSRLVRLTKLSSVKLPVEITHHSLDEDSKKLQYLLKATSKTYAIAIPKLGQRDLVNNITFAYLVDRTIDELEVLLDIDRSRGGKSPEEVKDLGDLVLDAVDKNEFSTVEKAKFALAEVPVAKKGYRILFDNIAFLSHIAQETPENVKGSIIRYARSMVKGFANPDIQEIETFSDYDRYCHRAAGLVGYQITKTLFDLGLINEDELDYLIPHPGLYKRGINPANDFALALQSVNDIKDLFDDTNSGTYRWPLQDVLVKNNISNFKQLTNPQSDTEKANSTLALTDMVNNTVSIFPGADNYIQGLPKDPYGPRNFCGFALSLSALTLREVNNGHFFEKRGKLSPSKIELADLDIVSEEIARRGDSFLPYTEHLLSGNDSRTYLSK